MSSEHINRAPRPSIAAKAVIGLTAVAGVAMGVNAEPAQAATTNNAIEIGQSTNPSEVNNIPGSVESATSSNMPKEALAYIENNAVLIKNLDCSGALIRDPSTHVPIGVRTAAHCGLRYNNTNTNAGEYAYGTTWVQGGDGKEYIVKSGGLQVQLGNSWNKGLAVGEITKFALPKKGDNTIDEAVGAFGDNSIAHVLQVLNSENLTQEQINHLKPGDKLYMGSWPYQQNNNQGEKQLQRFGMEYIGTTVATNTAGEKEDVLLAAIKEDHDGATCSEGASGSQAFYIQKTYANGKVEHKVRPIGVLSVAWQLKPGINGTSANDAASSLNYFKNKYPWYGKWDSTTSVCGITVKPLNAANGYSEVNVVSSTENIPDPIVKGEAAAAELFWSPEHRTSVIKGIVDATIKNADGAPEPITLVNPIAFFNSDETLTLCFDKNGEGGILGCRVFKNLNDLVVYPESTAAGVGIVYPSGIKSINNTEGSLGSFTDKNGLVFGSLIDPNTQVDKGATPYRITNDHGVPKFHALPNHE